jgi:hypothetical protein
MFGKRREWRRSHAVMNYVTIGSNIDNVSRIKNGYAYYIPLLYITKHF